MLSGIGFILGVIVVIALGVYIGMMLYLLTKWRIESRQLVEMSSEIRVAPGIDAEEVARTVSEKLKREIAKVR